MTPDLTRRQLDLLVHIALTGCTIKEAAAYLGISEQTAKNLLWRAYVTLDVRSLVGAYGVLGWLKVPE